MWYLYLIAIVLIILFSYLVSSKFKGIFGEKYISGKLKRIDKNKKYIINNLLIKDKESFETSQIDHLLISRKGIFCVETKNYSGKIYGNDYKSDWIQYLNYGKVKNIFYSPVKQNQIHCNRISDILNKKYLINNIVIFMKADLKRVNSISTFYIKDFKKYYNTLKELFKEEEIEEIYKNIIDYKNKYNIKMKDHLNNIKEMKNKELQNQLDEVCPECKGKLIKRKGKYGEFIGCSNYPKCKYTKSNK